VLVRSVTSREPEWTEQDRAEMLALALYRQGLCPKCGNPVDDCTSEETLGPEFAVSYSTCRASRAVLERQRAISDNGKKDVPNAPAYLWSTTPIRKR
jgi:hypothetical protein